MPIDFDNSKGPKPGLVIYLTVGDPDLATTREIAVAARAVDVPLSVFFDLGTLPCRLLLRLLIADSAVQLFTLPD